MQHGAYYMFPTGRQEDEEEEQRDVEIGDNNPVEVEQFHNTIIEASRVIEPKLAEAKPAWSRRKIALVSVATCLTMAGLIIGVSIAATRDDEPEDPLPVFTDKDELRAFTLSLITGNLTTTSHPIGTWDVSNVTDFSELFSAQQFGGDLFATFDENISQWETSQVTNMSGKKGCHNGGDSPLRCKTSGVRRLSGLQGSLT